MPRRLRASAQGGRSPHTLFYSRRIGLTAPIFLAGKLTGSVGSTQVGLLDAVVTGPWVGLKSDGKRSRAFSVHAERPFHFSLDDELPTEPVTSTNYFAGVIRQQATKNAALGVSVTSAIPMATGCAPTDVCDPSGGNAAALDWKLTTDSGDWSWLGQLEGSMVTGPKERTLRDGTLLRAFDNGWGFYMRGGKVGGEPFRFRVDLEYAAPTLELNQTGFLQNQNFARAQAWAMWVKTGMSGLLSELYASIGTGHNVSTDGRDVYRGGGAWINAEAVLSTFDFIGCNLAAEAARYDIREVARTGIPFGRGGAVYVDCYFQTDGNRTLQLTGNMAYGAHLPHGLFKGSSGYGGEVTGRLRFHPRLQTELTVGLDYTPHGPRYVETLSEGLHRLGNLQSRYLSLTLRQQLVLTPRLTLQGYAQLFTDAEYTQDFFNAASTGRKAIKAEHLVAVSAPEQIERSSALNFNLVLRWEYRLGSTLYAVYARDQRGTPSKTVRGFEALAPDRLFAGPATDSILVKWSYWWG